MTEQNDLAALRTEIDGIDHSLVSLITRRMEISGEIADYKKEHGLAIFDRGRERDILGKVSDLAGKDFAGYLRILYTTLFELSRSYQHTKNDPAGTFAETIRNAKEKAGLLFPKEATVACQGVEGANSQIACDKVFDFARITYVRNFEGVFSAVESGLCRYGILPIENSSHGSVNAVYDLMGSHKFSIVRGIKLHIEHCLLTKEGTPLSGIRESVSHEQALGQCSRYLASLPGVRITVAENTAAAAKMVSESSRTDLAAIASEDCAVLYPLIVAKRGIQDTDNNYTRFIVISKQPEIYPGSDKISIMFSVSNTPGALSRLIARFSSLSLNMTKLESRPIAGTDFRYRFYVDVEASVDDPAVVRLLQDMEHDIEGFVFLGCYRE